MNKTVIRVGLETLYFSGMHRIAAQFLAGSGAILTFHRVRPALADAFQPNRLLEITPAFLDEVLKTLRAADIDIIPIDAMAARLANPTDRRFVVLTFDDGYRDNRDHALPVLERHDAPFTMFVPSAFAEGAGELWWVAIEEAIARHDAMEVNLGGTVHSLDTATTEGKQAAFETIYAHLMSLPTEAAFRAVVREICAAYGVDMARQCREACMGWDELKTFAGNPLVTIGGHTVTHPILTKLDAKAALAEMTEGADTLAAKLGQRPKHFSYPVGSPAAAGSREFALAREAGFTTAVTTRPGVLFPEHAEHLSALPRISVNGEFQRRRYLDVLLSGAATALMNRFRRVDAA